MLRPGMHTGGSSRSLLGSSRVSSRQKLARFRSKQHIPMNQSPEQNKYKRRGTSYLPVIGKQNSPDKNKLSPLHDS